MKNTTQLAKKIEKGKAKEQGRSVKNYREEWQEALRLLNSKRSKQVRKAGSPESGFEIATSGASSIVASPLVAIGELSTFWIV